MDFYYCLIRLQKNKRITIFVYNNNLSLNGSTSIICFTACSANLICSLIVRHSCIKYFSNKHLLYLGQELYKAELCALMNQIYVQN